MKAAELAGEFARLIRNKRRQQSAPKRWQQSFDRNFCDSLTVPSLPDLLYWDCLSDAHFIRAVGFAV